MKVLIVGSGGREDALAWAISRSPDLTRLDCAPGNAGMARRGHCLDLKADDVDGLARHAVETGYDLVVIGPEAPLVAGLADRLREAGVTVFGPEAAAARLEGSKAFSKEFMTRHGVPTAEYRIFDRLDEAEAWLRSSEAFFPCVVKADGLAAGKGVLLVDDVDQAVAAARSMLEEARFGDAGSRVVIERRLEGREVSFFVLSDGTRFQPLATCQDYKRAEDGDAGPNTGGMGTYSPSAYLDEPTRQQLIETVVRPTLDGLRSEGTPFRGVLFIGAMLTADGPRVLEYNARFGDPETQVLMPRLDGDWLSLLHACAAGRLPEEPLAWKSDAAVCVVLAAGGYPGSYDRGAPIEGLDRVATMGKVEVFHAGTANDGERIVTHGGRVLGVTAWGPDLEAARKRAYEAVNQISWSGVQHRRDIAADAVRRLQQEHR